MPNQQTYGHECEIYSAAAGGVCNWRNMTAEQLEKLAAAPKSENNGVSRCHYDAGKPCAGMPIANCAMRKSVLARRAQEQTRVLEATTA